MAKWVYERAQKRTDAEYELVDLLDFNLPLLDESTNKGVLLEFVMDQKRGR